MPTRTTYKHYKKSSDITTLFVVFKLRAVVVHLLRVCLGCIGVGFLDLKQPGGFLKKKLRYDFLVEKVKAGFLVLKTVVGFLILKMLVGFLIAKIILAILYRRYNIFFVVDNTPHEPLLPY